MAGHSQWANRKHRKQRQDKKKGKIFSKMARKITVAAREGGGDPETNPHLRMLVEKARSLDVPKDNIQRAIKRGTGELEGVSYEEFTYEGYGPGGVAILLQVLTDNRNRAASELRHIFDQHGGNLADSGSVAWMFEPRGRLTVEGVDVNEDDLMLSVLEAGGEELTRDDGLFTIDTAPEELHTVKDGLEDDGVTVSDAELIMEPTTLVPVDGGDARRLLRLLDELDDHDDVDAVYTNFEMSQEELAEYTA